MRVLIVIPTTAGPARIRKLTRRSHLPASMAVADGDFRPLPLSEGYSRLTAPGGPLASAFGPAAAGSFELRVDRAIETGRSWEVPVALAHALVARGETLVERPEDADLVVWSTGALDADLSIVPLDYSVGAKLHRSEEFFGSCAQDRRRVVVALPPASDGAVAAQARALLPEPPNRFASIGHVNELLRLCGAGPNLDHRGFEPGNVFRKAVAEEKSWSQDGAGDAIDPPGPGLASRALAAGVMLMLLAGGGWGAVQVTRFLIPGPGPNGPGEPGGRRDAADPARTVVAGDPPAAHVVAVAEPPREATAPPVREALATVQPKAPIADPGKPGTSADADRPKASPPDGTTAPAVLTPVSTQTAATPAAASLPAPEPPAPRPPASATPPAAPPVRITALQAPAGGSCGDILYGSAQAERHPLAVSDDGQFDAPERARLCGIEFDGTASGAAAEFAVDPALTNAASRGSAIPGSDPSRWRKLTLYLRGRGGEQPAYRVVAYGGRADGRGDQTAYTLRFGRRP